MKSTLAIILSILVMAQLVSAQSGGTVKSRFGIGELSMQSTGRSLGMGAVSVPLNSNFDISRTNPAAWSAVTELRLQGGFLYDFVQFSNTNAEWKDGALDGFQLVFPAEETYRTRFSVGLVPYSRSFYHVIGRGQTDLGEAYTVNYRGSGGLSLFRAGASIQPHSLVAIGVSFQYYFGTVEQESEVNFDNTAFFGSVQKVATGHTGSNFLLGMMLFPFEGMTAAATLTSSAKLNASRNLLQQYSTRDSIITGASGRQDIPLELRFGLSYQLTNKVLVAADYMQQDWSNAIVFDGKQKNLGEAYIWSVGLEWMPWKDEISAKNLSQLAFRLGYYDRQSYIRINDETDQEHMFTTGFGFPVFGSSRGDLALQYGWQGSTDQLLGKRTIMRLAASISIGEKWFVRDQQ